MFKVSFAFNNLLKHNYFNTYFLDLKINLNEKNQASDLNVINYLDLKGLKQPKNIFNER